MHDIDSCLYEDCEHRTFKDVAAVQVHVFDCAAHRNSPHVSSQVRDDLADIGRYRNGETRWKVIRNLFAGGRPVGVTTLSVPVRPGVTGSSSPAPAHSPDYISLTPGPSSIAQPLQEPASRAPASIFGDRTFYDEMMSITAAALQEKQEIDTEINIRTAARIRQEQELAERDKEIRKAACQRSCDEKIHSVVMRRSELFFPSQQPAVFTEDVAGTALTPQGDFAAPSLRTDENLLAYGGRTIYQRQQKSGRAKTTSCRIRDQRRCLQQQ